MLGVSEAVVQGWKQRREITSKYACQRSFTKTDAEAERVRTQEPLLRARSCDIYDR